MPSTSQLPKTIPTLDFSLLSHDETKHQFLQELRDALFHHGFFYLSNVLPEAAFQDIKSESLKFFDIPLEEKLKVAMVHSKHFLGYNGLGDEITAKNVDWREQVEFATELPEPIITDEDDLYKNLEGPNLWPSSRYLPSFKPTVSGYIDELSELARTLSSAIEDAIGLPSGSLQKFFKEIQQAKLKIIKYPDLSSRSADVASVKREFDNSQFKTELFQGVGEHRDNDFLTLIYQATPHNSLQVKDYNGDWIDVPPVENTLVFAVGMTLEYITQGVCVSTVHRVLSPVPGQGDRLSVSFFQSIDIESKKENVEISDEAKKLVAERDASRIKNKIGFQFQVAEDKPVGYSVFLNRIKSHPKVGERWYPKINKWVLEQVKESANC
ncbi:NGD3 [Cyberlindnera jadinii]|uniref:NGD3 protein n=1 Tax=Cyberlindnera jadinii (strain ATCC 18201 / CBS 1600 / BCRC 20928 / JCM 3617 / NBRC 0987 / NRRL Y-1542) TaxID=983966 RepID=A0A0H5CBI7_CYBJN|nr:NGD3 [Cyberlindnera jadinii]